MGYIREFTVVIFGMECQLARKSLEDAQDVKKDTNLAFGMCRHVSRFNIEFNLDNKPLTYNA